MKKFMHFCVAALIGAAALSFAACGGDDNNKDPNGNGGGSVPDPEGTVWVQVRNNFDTWVEPESFGWSTLSSGWIQGAFSIDEANNFNVDDGMNGDDIIAIGNIAGLGNIRNIPDIGWAKKSAVIPGNGYVIRCQSRSYVYCRIYVVDYIKSTGGGIIGATVKYQSPFIPENLPQSE